MIGNKKKVFHGYAVMTKNGLTINDLTLNSRGKIVQKGGLLDSERQLMEQALTEQVAADTETLEWIHPFSFLVMKNPAARTLDPPLAENAWFTLISLGLRRNYHQVRANEAAKKVSSIKGREGFGRCVSVPDLGSLMSKSSIQMIQDIRFNNLNKSSDQLIREIRFAELGGLGKTLSPEDKIKLGLPDASTHPP